jgi:hypothetical protein
LTTAEAGSELRFDPPGPGTWEQDPVHFPRALTRYWTETHPAAFARGTAEFASFYGMLLGGLEMRYVNGIAYKAARPAPEEEIPQRLQRAEQVLAEKLWREQIWNDNRETLRTAVWGRESLIVWALRSHFRRRREWPRVYAHLHVVRLRTPAAVERFLASLQSPERPTDV